MHSNIHRGRLARAHSSARLAPVQARSRATRERILGSLAQLLNAQPFDQISVAELTAAAGCSMSSFYARFPTKAALLNSFFDRFFEVSSLELRAALKSIAADGGAAETRARSFIRFVLQSYRKHRGLLRSLILHDRLHPETGFAKRTRVYKQDVSRAVLSVLVAEPARSTERATSSARFAFWLVIQAAEQIVLFADPILEDDKMSDDQLVEELTAVLVRGINASSRHRRSIGAGPGDRARQNR